MSRVEAILNFWFGHPQNPDYGKPRQVWFKKDSAFDQEIHSLFLADYQQAASGGLESWQETPLSGLALIILLDQFPRNLFRGTPQAFATDSQALTAAQYVVKMGLDKSLLPIQRWFIYLPFEHSEDLQIQRQSVELFQQLDQDLDNQDALDYAIRHYEIIERFGRFPHRNVILGRETTPEEAEFLKQPGSSF